jgi:serine/threonine-protein kinase
MPKLLSLPTLPAPESSSVPVSSHEARRSSGEEDPLLGKTLNGTYVVESVLGEGGMGRVYKAHHTRMRQKHFAIKVLRPEFTRNNEVLARFRREAEAAACISHPNVVGVYDADATGDGFAFLVCEYLEGVDLAAQIERSKRVDIPMAAHIGVQICRALEAAHARGVVHRDLKPHNVFLMAESSGAISPRPTIKVLDFGLSRFMDSSDTQLTRTGVIMGTPAYMAPEQAKALEADHRADIYGVGCILYVALTGRPPFEAEHVQGIVLAVMTEEPRPPRSLNSAIPENLELVIQRAMAKEPSDRYQSMAELRAALEPFALADAFESSDRRGRSSGQRGSRAMLEAEARLVSTARPRLLVAGFVSLCLLIAGLSSTVASIELLTGKLRFTNTELALILLGIAGTLLTPGLISIRRFKKSVWINHAKVLELLATVQSALMTAIVTYGLCAIGVRFLDDVVARFGVSPLLGQGGGAGWPGWNLLFFLIALSAGLIAGWRKRLSESDAGLVRVLVRPGLLLAMTLVPAIVLYAGLLWRTGSSATEALREVAATPEKVAAALTPPQPSVGTLPPQPPVTENSGQERANAPASSVIERAPAQELADAASKGVDGLLPLAERFPQDPAVLKPLVLAFASRATGLADAMAVTKRLLQVAPEESRDQDLRFLVKKGAASPGEASRLAFELMSTQMGSTGPDLLYELYIGSPKASKRAQELLDIDAIKQKASPALLVAYELRKTESCAGRLKFLARAAELGDERSVAVLAPLSVGSKKGCGKWKRQPCPPACPAEAQRYSETVARINARLSQTRSP